MPTETAIAALIGTRAKVLGLSKADVVKRCGYQNVAKGVRRLDELCGGEFGHCQLLLDGLADALKVDPSVVQAAVEATREQPLREHELRYRETFRPHAVIICERTRPEPIWLASLIGIDNLLRVNFEAATSPVTYPRQALEGLNTKLRKWNAPVIPAFGSPIGFAVCYRPHKAVEFNLKCEPLRQSGSAYAPRACLSIRGRKS